MNQSDLDQDRVEQIVFGMMNTIEANYDRGPIARERVYEALGALAFCTATIIAGIDRSEGIKWFSDALNDCLKQYGNQSK